MKCQCVVFVLSLLLPWMNAQSASCTTPLGARSQCMILTNCPSLLSAFARLPLPANIVTFLRQSQCGFDKTTPKVCCGPLPSNTDTTPRPMQRTTTANSKSYVGPSDSAVEEDSQLPPRGQCGQDTNGNRIFGGNITEIGEHPWMALLGYRTRAGKITYQCGGALINARYVLTAAHCITGAVERDVGKLTTVRLGEYNTDTAQDCQEEDDCADAPQEIAVQDAYPHFDYIDGNKNRQGDIGIVKLARRATYSYYVQPICLVDKQSSKLKAGTHMVVAGWGKTLSGRNSPVKLKLELSVFDKDTCVTKYRTLGAEISDKQICAGGAFAEDACRGDSGGPLMQLRYDGVWESAGVISFGYGCGRDGWPGVYTSVAGYKDWIMDTLRSTNV